MSNTLNDNIYQYYIILSISFRSITVIIVIYFRIIIFGSIFSQSSGQRYFLALDHDFGLKYIRKKLFEIYYNCIDLNVIYKIIYYKYILFIKVLDIIGVKHNRPFKTMG